jgi:hypothetical protein
MLSFPTLYDLFLVNNGSFSFSREGMNGGVGTFLISLRYEWLVTEMHIASRVCIWISQAWEVGVVNLATLVTPCVDWRYTGFTISALKLVIKISYIVTKLITNLEATL